MIKLTGYIFDKQMHELGVNSDDQESDLLFKKDSIVAILDNPQGSFIYLIGGHNFLVKEKPSEILSLL